MELSLGKPTELIRLARVLEWQYPNSLGVNLRSKYKGHVFLSIMTDSATDAGVREVEDMYVHFLKDEEAVNAFVGLKSCSNAKAPGITEAVNSAMTDV